MRPDGPKDMMLDGPAVWNTRSLLFEPRLKMENSMEEIAIEYVKRVGVDRAIDLVIQTDPLTLSKYATASDDGSRLVGQRGLERWSEENLAALMINDLIKKEKICKNTIV